MVEKEEITYAFVDASNLFYGGEKNLGWSVDYKKLLDYLKKKYHVSKVFYYAGIDIGKYEPKGKDVNLDDLIKHLRVRLNDPKLGEAEIVLIGRYIQRAKFYKKLALFGYVLKIKPVKTYGSGETLTKKANCDVDLTFDLMRLMSQYEKLVILSGDGDFAPVLKYLRLKGKEISILARSERTAREIKQLAGGDFADFTYLQNELEFIRPSK